MNAAQATLLIAVGFAVGALIVVTRQLAQTRRRLKASQAALLQAAWFEWWTRNAAETPRDKPERPYLVRLAYAAQLAPSLERFRDDCEVLANDQTKPLTLRLAAKSFAEELRAKHKPWLCLPAGAPWHSQARIEAAYHEAMSCIPLGLAEAPAVQLQHEPTQNLTGDA